MIYSAINSLSTGMITRERRQFSECEICLQGRWLSSLVWQIFWVLPVLEYPSWLLDFMLWVLEVLVCHSGCWQYLSLCSQYLKYSSTSSIGSTQDWLLLNYYYYNYWDYNLVAKKSYHSYLHRYCYNGLQQSTTPQSPINSWSQRALCLITQSEISTIYSKEIKFYDAFKTFRPTFLNVQLILIHLTCLRANLRDC